MLADPALLSRVSLIVSDYDRIVPAHEASLPGAREIIPVNDRTWWSQYDPRQGHIRLPVHARKQIVRIVAEEDRTAQPAA